MPPKSWTQPIVIMKEKFLKRLRAVELYQQGHSAKQVAELLHCDHHDVVIWSKRYEKHGEKGLQSRPHRQLTVDEKVKIRTLYLQKNVSLYDLGVMFQISYTTVKKMTRQPIETLSEKYKQEDFNYINMRRSKRPEPQTELERLQRENEYLRAENALLKKVRTLMQEKRNRRVGIGQSPSEH